MTSELITTTLEAATTTIGPEYAVGERVDSNGVWKGGVLRATIIDQPEAHAVDDRVTVLLRLWDATVAGSETLRFAFYTDTVFCRDASRANLDLLHSGADVMIVTKASGSGSVEASDPPIVSGVAVFVDCP